MSHEQININFSIKIIISVLILKLDNKYYRQKYLNKTQQGIDLYKKLLLIFFFLNIFKDKLVK